MKEHFQVSNGTDGKIRFHLMDEFGQRVASGRGYTSKSECMHGIASLMRYGPLEGCILRRESINGMFFFQVKSPSGRLLAWSKFRYSHKTRDEDIDEMVKALKSAQVVDLCK